MTPGARGFDGAFADAARRASSARSSTATRSASFDVGFAGAQLKATVAEREPRLREPLSRVDASDLMDLSGGGAEGALRHLAPTARRSAVAGVPRALCWPSFLLGAGILAAHGPPTRAARRGALRGARPAGRVGRRLGGRARVHPHPVRHQPRRRRRRHDLGRVPGRPAPVEPRPRGCRDRGSRSCVAATLPAGEPGPAATPAHARAVAGERLSGLLALGLLMLAVVVLAARELVMDLFVVRRWPAPCCTAACSQLARLAVR